MAFEIEHLKQHVQGQLLRNQSLAKYSSWRCGGCAEWLFLPVDKQDLQICLRHLDPEIPVCFLGLGSNTLVRSGGLPGLTIVTLKALKSLLLCDEQQIFAEAGVSGGKVARFSARHGFEGLEFLAGVPGTVGGALKMNAGAYGGETWEYVTQVQVINRQAEIYQRLPQDYDVQYRHVSSPYDDEEFFVGAWFQPRQGGDPQTIQQYIKTMLGERNQAQPVNWPNGGSIFRNPSNDYAARLIEACGLKGYRIGGACISARHANFIINDQRASPEDIEALVDYMEQTIKDKQGITLQREIHIMGNRSEQDGNSVK